VSDARLGRLFFGLMCSEGYDEQVDLGILPVTRTSALQASKLL